MIPFNVTIKSSSSSFLSRRLMRVSLIENETKLLEIYFRFRWRKHRETKCCRKSRSQSNKKAKALRVSSRSIVDSSFMVVDGMGGVHKLR